MLFGRAMEQLLVSRNSGAIASFTSIGIGLAAIVGIAAILFIVWFVSSHKPVSISLGAAVTYYVFFFSPILLGFIFGPFGLEHRPLSNNREQPQKGLTRRAPEFFPVQSSVVVLVCHSK